MIVIMILALKKSMIVIMILALKKSMIVIMIPALRKRPFGFFLSSCFICPDMSYRLTG